METFYGERESEGFLAMIFYPLNKDHPSVQ